FLSLPFPAAQCPFPRVQHGRVFPGHYHYRTGDTVTFSCSPGHTLRGPRSSTCGPGSRWSPPPPECKKGECPRRVSSAG
ncbi:CR2 protein, partial [Nicator chloris]|nr:CR2 protein [Nicator chloris]